MAEPPQEFWTPEPIWRGRTAFLLGGGPSLRTFDCERLRGRAVMAINSSCHLAPWADILCFTDNNWFDAHRDIVATWPGLVVSVSRAAKRHLRDKVRRIQLEGHGPGFPPPGAPTVRHGRSSGHTGAALAVAMAAARIVLLGYDMRKVGDRTHHHDDYFERDDSIYAGEFIPGFAGWYADALKLGTTIVNATPGSALTEFPMVSIDDELARSESNG